MMVPPTALLVIDAQQGLLDGEGAVPDALGVVHRIRTVLAAARSAGALVVHLQNDGDSGSLDEPGTPGWLIHPQVAPEPNELVLRKCRDDGFDGTELADVLTRNQVTRLAIVGLLSEMCVSATVRGALARGLQVVLVRDAHATYNLDDIPSSVVSRVAEHALGDEVDLIDAVSVGFERTAMASAYATCTSATRCRRTRRWS
ncbi:MAG: cysteine hydrolase [Chloroflexota bacterium]|nr:cysteine hydrolase [Chloroflexota bacterium]